MVGEACFRGLAGVPRKVTFMLGDRLQLLAAFEE